MSYTSYNFPSLNYWNINNSKPKLSQFEEMFQTKVDEFNGLFEGLTQSLYVGNVETLQKILDNLNESIITESTKLSTHLDSISTFMGKVTGYMEQDRDAKAAAESKYNSIYDETKDNSSDAASAAEKVWKSNRCALWR